MEKCFVIMPFDKRLDGTYQQIVHVCNRLNIEPRRSDHTAVGSITKEIFIEISNAKIVIADLSFSNPNVYYELAISHCIGRKTILISRTDQDIPFNVRDNYVIRYSDSIIGAKDLEIELEKKIKYLLDGGVIDNPAQMFLPKSKEEEKLNKLSDMSREIMFTLLESRKIELEIFVDSPVTSLVPSAKGKIDRHLNDIKKIIDEINS